MISEMNPKKHLKSPNTNSFGGQRKFLENENEDSKKKQF